MISTGWLRVRILASIGLPGLADVLAEFMTADAVERDHATKTA
jgi:hypothetical protein